MFNPLDFVHALDFESSTPRVVTATGADMLQHYLDNPHLAESLPYDTTAKAHGPIAVTVSAVDASGNEAAAVVLPIYISTTAEACPGKILCENGSCSSQGLCLQQAARDFLAASGLLPNYDMSTNPTCVGYTVAAPTHVCFNNPVHDSAPPVVTALGQPPEHVRVAGRRKNHCRIFSQCQLPLH